MHYALIKRISGSTMALVGKGRIRSHGSNFILQKVIKACSKIILKMLKAMNTVNGHVRISNLLFEKRLEWGNQEVRLLGLYFCGPVV